MQSLILIFKDSKFIQNKYESPSNYNRKKNVWQDPFSIYISLQGEHQCISYYCIEMINKCVDKVSLHTFPTKFFDKPRSQSRERLNPYHYQRRQLKPQQLGNLALFFDTKNCKKLDKSLVIHHKVKTVKACEQGKLNENIKKNQQNGQDSVEETTFVTF